MKKVLISFIFLVMCLPISYLYAEDASIDNGKNIFHKRCALCHFAEKDQNKLGPTLHNLIGRKAASVKTYKYSKAMEQAAANGLIWNDDNVKTYLHNPHKMVPGTKMAILFMHNEQELTDLIEYLKSIPKKLSGT